MMMKPMVQSQTLIRPARSAVPHGKLSKQQQQQLKRGGDTVLSSEVRWTKTQDSSYIVLATPLKSRLTSHGAHGP